MAGGNGPEREPQKSAYDLENGKQLQKEMEKALQRAGGNGPERK